MGAMVRTFNFGDRQGEFIGGSLHRNDRVEVGGEGGGDAWGGGPPAPATGGGTGDGASEGHPRT